MKRAGRAIVVGAILTSGGLAFAPPCSAQESAIASAKAHAKASPRDPAAALAYGRALVRAGRVAEALTELRRGIAASGKNTDGVANLQWEVARAHIAQREFQAAMRACKTIAKIPSELSVSRVCAAEAHLLWRRGSEALTETEALAKETAGGRSVPLNVQYASKIAEGRAHELASNDAVAEAAYREAIRIDPTRTEGLRRLGLLLDRRGEDGRTFLRKAVSADPADPDAQYALGLALTTGSAESLAALERAVKDRPSFLDAKRALADGYLAANRLKDAKTVVDAVLAAAPNDVGSRISAGHVALAEGRADDAIKEGEAAFKLMPNVAAAKLLIADGWASKGEIDLALEAYQAAIGLDHSDVTPLLNATSACLKAGRTTSAKAFGRRATQEFATDARAWMVLGDALIADKDKVGAKRAFETARNAHNADPAAIDRALGRVSLLK